MIRYYSGLQDIYIMYVYIYVCICYVSERPTVAKWRPYHSTLTFSLLDKDDEQLEEEE